MINERSASSVLLIETTSELSITKIERQIFSKHVCISKIVYSSKGKTFRKNYISCKLFKSRYLFTSEFYTKLPIYEILRPQ